MESAGYLTYRAETPMVIVRALRKIPRPDKPKSVFFEFHAIDGQGIKLIHLPRKLIDIWRYEDKGKPVIEVELPRWLAEKVGLEDSN